MSGIASRQVQEALKKIPFVFCVPLVYDEMCAFADILLPESHMLERYMVIEFGHHVVHAADEPELRMKGVLVQKPLIPPVNNTKQGEEIYLELADRLGILYGPGGLNDYLNSTLNLCPDHQLALDKKYSVAELMDHILRCHFGEEYGLDYFDEHAVYPRQLQRKEAYNFYYYPWGTTRHPFYYAQLYANGLELRKNLAAVGLQAPPGWKPEEIWPHYEPIPHWCGRPDEKAGVAYDLVATNWSTPQIRMGAGDQVGNVWIREHVMHTDPYDYRILMNTETARRKGLRDDDEIVVESWWGGRVRGKLRLTELLHPDAVGFPGIHGFKSRERNPITWLGPHFN
ncbi:MAG: hypothetical protein H5T84_07745, partial [Thermoleophilia bacterium]|nr:hypothetical protein [Thermoleophilia bacterium]